MQGGWRFQMIDVGGEAALDGLPVWVALDATGTPEAVRPLLSTRLGPGPVCFAFPSPTNPTIVRIEVYREGRKRRFDPESIAAAAAARAVAAIAEGHVLDWVRVLQGEWHCDVRVVRDKRGGLQGGVLLLEPQISEAGVQAAGKRGWITSYVDGVTRIALPGGTDPLEIGGGVAALSVSESTVATSEVRRFEVVDGCFSYRLDIEKSAATTRLGFSTHQSVPAWAPADIVLRQSDRPDLLVAE